MLRPPAGEVPVRFDGELTHSRPTRVGSAVRVRGARLTAEVDEAEPGGVDRMIWAWLDEADGLIRARVFVPEAGIAEDEATGSAAMRLAAALGRPIEIRQGVGSVIYARPLAAGPAEIGGRVALDEVRTTGWRVLVTAGVRATFA